MIRITKVIISIMRTESGLQKSMLSGLALATTLATTLALSAVPANAQEEIKIGVPLSLSGPVAFAGTKMRDAMELAFEEINGSDFLGGKKLVPVWADDRSSQPQAISVTQQLALREQVSVIAGYTASNICLAALPVAQELKVPTINSDCVVPGLGEVGDYVYNAVAPSADFVRQLITNFAAANKDVKSAAILYQRENPVFVGLEKLMTEVFTQNGIEVVAAEAVTSGADADFSAQLTSIASKKPGVLAILLIGGQVGPAMVQARQAGLADTIFMGEQNFDSIEVRNVAGPNAAGSVYPSHWFAASPVEQNKKFVAAYEARYGSTPDTFSANGYSTVWVLAQIIKKAGSGDREAIKKALEEAGDMDTIFGIDGKTAFENRVVKLTPFFFQMQANGTVKQINY